MTKHIAATRSRKLGAVLRAVVPALAVLAFGADAVASTITQNASWTIDRSGTSTKYRVVAYGDSIYAGFTTNLTAVAKYAGPTVQGEYLSALWNADIESIRRTKSGAVAKDVYENKVVAEKSYMQDSKTRVITIEMCGNDGLQARSAFKKQTGTCDYSILDTALNNCKTYMGRSIDFINANAYSGVKLKTVSNLHYPGIDADNVQSSCKDATTGKTVNVLDLMIKRSAMMNYWICEIARQKGWYCADSFAQHNAADYDSNGDGKIDSEAIAWVPGESESSYVNRLNGALKSTIRDANKKMITARTSYDYIQSDDTHPTFTGGTTSTGLRGQATGSAKPRYTSFTNGKSPIWNQFGHERLGWAISAPNPAKP